MNNIFGGRFISRYRDEHGRNVERTPETHRYSYSPYVQYQAGKPEDADNVVYSDRLSQWDYKKVSELKKKHFGEQSDYYSNKEPKKIEAFLSDFFDKPIELLIMMEGANHATGYPYWVFFMRDKKV